MKLSGKIRRIITNSNLGGEWREIVSGWADEVTQLEAELENYKAGNKDLKEGLITLVSGEYDETE